MEGSPSSIGKLIPKSIAAKRRRRRESSIAETTASSNSADDATPERNNLSRYTTLVNEATTGSQDREAARGSQKLDTNPAEATEEDSLISYDSDNEA